jgi:predicted nucleotidyltransferase
MSIIDQNIDSLHDLCKKHEVEKLYSFGSVTNTTFNSNSDIDLLVRFKQIDLAKYFDNYLSFKEKLKALFNREIDLVEEQALKNPILIQSIEREKKLIYG